MRKQLFISGPTMVDNDIKEAMIYDDISHRENEFESLFKSTQKELYRLVNADSTKYVALLTTGSGTSATEAMISSFLPNEDTLILSNGEFGERLINQAKIFSVPCAILKYELGREFDLQEIELVLKKNKKIKNILFSWVETSTGVLNPLEKICSIAEKNKKSVFVDCVSSIGCEKINLKQTSISCIVGHSGKAIGAFPGIGIVICNRTLFNKKNYNKSYYLNLFKYYDYAIKYSQTPHTPAIPLIFSLNTAIKKINKNQDLNIKRFKDTHNYLSKSLEKIGVELFLDKKIEKCSSVIAAYVPKNIKYDILKNKLNKAGYVIYGGRGYLEENNLFLVSNMSRSINRRLIDKFITAFHDIIKK